MLKQLRTQTKTIMWLVALAFVGLMLFQWGMDFTGRQENGARISDAVGMVNGEKISLTSYENALANNRRAYTERNKGEFPAFMEKMLEDQTWETLVGEALLRQEANRRGIRVTDADILAQIQTSPPREVMQLDAFQTNGRFDPQKYQQALSDPRYDWTWLENYVRAYLPQQKVQERVVSSVVVSDAEAREEFARRQDQVRVAYVGFKAQDFPAATVAPGEEALKAYYQAHPREFERPPMATVTMIRIPKTVTEQDWKDAMESLAEAKKEVDGGTAFEDVVPDYSDAPNASTGGDLGWIAKGALGDPVAEPALFALEAPNSVSQPVRGSKAVYLFQLLERQGDRLHARAIVIHPEAGHESVAALVSRGEGIRAQAKNGGLKAAASSAGITATMVGPFEVQATPPELVDAPDAARFVADAKEGEVSPVFDEKQSVVVVEVTRKTEAGTRPMEEVRSQLVEAVTFEARVNRAAEKAADLARAAQAGRDLAGAARARGLTMSESALFSRTSPPPDFASNRALTAMAFALPVGEVGPPVREHSAAYVIKVLEHHAASPEDFARARDGIMQELLYQKRQEAFSAWYQEIKESATIEDRRAELLAAAGAQGGDTDTGE